MRYDFFPLLPLHGIITVASVLSFEMFTFNFNGKHNDFQHYILAKGIKLLFRSIKSFWRKVDVIFKSLQPHTHMQSLHISRTLLQHTSSYQSCSGSKLYCITVLLQRSVQRSYTLWITNTHWTCFLARTSKKPPPEGLQSPVLPVPSCFVKLKLVQIMWPFRGSGEKLLI